MSDYKIIKLPIGHKDKTELFYYKRYSKKVNEEQVFDEDRTL